MPSFSQTTLANYYKKLGVAYRKSNIVYVRKVETESDLIKEQKIFSLGLVSQLIAQEREIIYVDETTFHLW